MVNDSTVVVFDDGRAVANAGLMLPAVLAARLGLEGLVDELVDLGDRPGAANPGRKTMTLVSAMALGADCIDDCDVLRAGRTADVLGHRVAAPSTLGTFLRAFTFGHVRQLDRVLGESLQRAWAAGAGAGDGRLVVDVDSFVGETFGPKKQGAAFGYTRRRGYHPLLSVRADTGEVLHIRLRKGSANTSRGMQRFCDELSARVQRAGAVGPKPLRADSGFWSNDTFERLERMGWQHSIGVRLHPHVRAAIEGSPGRTAAALGAGCRPGSWFPSSPTAPSCSPLWRPNTASTPSSSSPSATSKTNRSHTSPPGASSPTPRGRSSSRSPTTCLRW